MANRLKNGPRKWENAAFFLKEHVNKEDLVHSLVASEKAKSVKDISHSLTHLNFFSVQALYKQRFINIIDFCQSKISSANATTKHENVYGALEDARFWMKVPLLSR